MLFGAVIVQVPIGMALLSVLLRRKYSRPVTFAAVILSTAGIVSNAPTDMDDLLHLVVELGAMAAIL